MICNLHTSLCVLQKNPKQTWKILKMKLKIIWNPQSETSTNIKVTLQILHQKPQEVHFRTDWLGGWGRFFLNLPHQNPSCFPFLFEVTGQLCYVWVLQHNKTKQCKSKEHEIKCRICQHGCWKAMEIACRPILLLKKPRHYAKSGIFKTLRSIEWMHNDSSRKSVVIWLIPTMSGAHVHDATGHIMRHHYLEQSPIWFRSLLKFYIAGWNLCIPSNVVFASGAGCQWLMEAANYTVCKYKFKTIMSTWEVLQWVKLAIRLANAFRLMAYWPKCGWGEWEAIKGELAKGNGKKFLVAGKCWCRLIWDLSSCLLLLFSWRGAGGESKHNV